MLMKSVRDGLMAVVVVKLKKCRRENEVKEKKLQNKKKNIKYSLYLNT